MDCSKCNCGGVDRSLRLLVGGGLVAWAAAFDGPKWAWVGIVPLATGALGFCPLYPLIGVNTCCGSDKKCCGGKKE